MNRFVISLSALLIMASVNGYCVKAGVSKVKSTADTALDRYISKPNPDYAWKIANETSVMGTDFVEIDMTSQKWMGGLWQHKVVLIRPTEIVNPKLAVLYITGGNISDVERMAMAVMARSAKAVVVALGGVPNQPLYDNLYEDDLIAYTLVHYQQDKNDEWPLLLPMTKSAVCAMTTAQAAAKQHWNMKIDKFMVTGGSKRGWTTWLTAAVDKRVAAIAPMVYDNLNLPKQMALQKSSYGAASAQIEAYTKLGLIDLLASEKNNALAKIIDPYSYINRITMPKLIVNGSNDPYWVFDSASIYYNQLTGSKRIMYAPNSGHGLDDRERVVGTLAGFYNSVSSGKTLADISASGKVVNGKLVVSGKVTGDVNKVDVWVAVNSTRDFRQVKFISAEAKRTGEVFNATVAIPQGSYVGWYADASQSVSKITAHVSTVASVIKVN